MKLNKEEFLKTELGKAVIECVRKRKECRYKEDDAAAAIYEIQWLAYRLAIRQFYGVDCRFVEVDRDYGI